MKSSHSGGISGLVVAGFLCGLFGATPESQGESALPGRVTFNEHIQPIFSENCYHCHGPDSSTREPEKEPLRLDTAEEAFKVRSFGAPVIVKGDPDASEIIYLMRSDDRSEIMPPPESHKVLDEREIALVEKWISQGAEYEGHWSYQPIVRVSPPQNEWSENPVDAFVLEKLREEGFEPNPEEDVRRLHRRMAFDLTGLPPEPAETEAFVAAYEKDKEAAVSSEADRMLATMDSAEHFARHWLDVARYADTHGIHVDNYRAIWPYRDWVVRAFHGNMRWDQFTTEQIAGDLLENPTLDQQVATGFLRSLATTGEGGAFPEEYEAVYAADRVDTMGAAWLGLTASCASCHDHKFDPFLTKEFYQLTAFFRNNTMSALDGNNATHPPSVFVPQMADKERWSDIQGQLREVEKRVSARRKQAKGDFEEWLATAEKEVVQKSDPTLAIHLPLVEAEGNLTGLIDGEAREWPVDPERIEGPLGSAIVVSGGKIELGDLGSFSREDQVSYGGFVWFKGKPTGAVVAKMNPGPEHRGWDIYLQGGKIGGHIIDTWNTSANKVVAPQQLKAGEWNHVMITFDGTKGGHQAMAVYVNGERAKVGATPNTVGASIENEVPLRLGSREGGQAKLKRRVALQDFRFYSRVLGAEEIFDLANFQKISSWLAIPTEDQTPKQRKGLFDYFISVEDAPSQELFRERDGLRAQESELRNRGSDSLVFVEKKKSEPSAHVLIRGSYASKGEQVFPDTPAMLPAMPQDAPKNRLGLAMWLNDPANPLPPRVTMNRLWSYFFGTGIVESSGDFGIMGARPTHPKLLDWLGDEFVASGWDFRHMAKLIVTSKTYRQSGKVSAGHLEKDPFNTLFTRGPRTRLQAEQIRDLALAAAGILSEKVGGAPVKPYQPDGLWKAVAMRQSNTKDYKRDSGEALYRRSLYTFWKRTAPPASMSIFDAPSRERFCVRREVTNTPLQALALMNDVQIVEAARLLATRSLYSSGDFDARLDEITTRLLSRKMEADERAHVKATLDQAMSYYSASPEQASAAIHVGESEPDDSLNAAELAAWTLVATQIFNLDETITK